MPRALDASTRKEERLNIYKLRAEIKEIENKHTRESYKKTKS